ncbi:FkbM family methyltransferase [Patescibacteria group bacterium]|nr:FkbM family methyltransferase [Patescibacteria group bacterium]
MISNDLIFDLGFHNGDDTNFYLTKGFRVIAIEANPKLVDAGSYRFDSEIRSGRLIILNKAISDNSGKVDFFVHATKTDWSSCLLDMAESNGSQSTHITVDSTNIHELFFDYGVPYYLKVDIEGCDILVARHLSRCESKPKFVSFEISRRDYFGIFSYLYVSGYSKFQLINQMNNPNRVIPKTIAGISNDLKFSEFSSGFFGNDLPEEKWLTFEEMLTRYIKYKELKQIDNTELGIGWLDVHAKIGE